MIALLALMAAVAPGDVSIAEDAAIYAYSFEWPKEAAAVPELDRRFRAEAAESRDSVVGDATSAHRQAQADKDHWFPDVGYQSTWGYEAAGSTPELLSLAGGWYSFTGGAHGMFGARALLWNRERKAEIQPSDLFVAHSEYVLLRPAMCADLTAQRIKKRGELKADTSYPALDEAFNGCPPFGDLTVWISDTDDNGRFDTFNFAADPYVAGPYSEGSYEMEVKLNERLLAAIKPEYRSAFEAQPAQ